MKEQKQSKLKGFALGMALVLAMGAAGTSLAMGIKNNGWFAPDNQEEEELPNGDTETSQTEVNDFVEVKTETDENAPVMLALALSENSVVTYANDTNTVSKTITATVLPATVKNTKVNWSVEWGESQSGTVTDYITVTPESAGSTKATVTCKKAFSGSIVIVCTTQEGGCVATCTVTFAGYPTDFNISGTIAESNGAYTLGIGMAYTYTVKLSNPFNSVGSQFNNISASVTAVGQIEVGDMEYQRTSGTEYWYDSSYETIALESIKDKLISVSYSDGTLSITIINAIENYYASMVRADAGRTLAYTDKFHSYVSDCYFNVTLTEATSKLSKTMKILYDSNIVTGVRLDVVEMTF